MTLHIPNDRRLDVVESWRLNGKVLVACNCDWGCPCNFNAPPTTGKCEGGLTWHVEKGSYGDIKLDGLNFSVYVNWPGSAPIRRGWRGLVTRHLLRSTASR
jgi:hypothetical protein